MRTLHRALVATAMLAAATTITYAQDDYPSKPIRIVVPLPPGGSNDVLARVLGNEMAEAFGQPVLVENRPGAAGNIGTDHIAKSAPDGYTLGIAPNQTAAVNPVLYSKLPFDASQDLTGVSMLARVPMILVVNGKSEIQSLDDVIQHAKANPSRLTYASAGAGSPQHMSAEIFQSLTNTDLTHVPYKGSAPALIDVLSGTVDIMFCPINSALSYVQDGRLKALGVTSTKRLENLPDVPAIAESIPEFESDIWIGLIAPAGTPPDILQKLNAELNRSLSLPAVRKTLAEQGIEAEASTVEAFDQLMAADRLRWGEVIRRANIQVD